MTGIVADINFQGHLDRLMYILRSPDFLELWDSYKLSVETFARLGIPPKTPDRIVWGRCQAEGLLLLTGNRNDDGPDSLAATIRDAPPDALPVFTLGDAQRVLEDAAFARVVASDLLDYIDDLAARPEYLSGAGRLYLPKETL